jgi:hypothetical protein
VLFARSVMSTAISYETEANRGRECLAGIPNWRGPIWFPINYLLIEALEKYHHFYRDDVQVESVRSVRGRWSIYSRAALEIATCGSRGYSPRTSTAGVPCLRRRIARFEGVIRTGVIYVQFHPPHISRDRGVVWVHRIRRGGRHVGLRGAVNMVATCPGRTSEGFPGSAERSWIPVVVFGDECVIENERLPLGGCPEPIEMAEMRRFARRVGCAGAPRRIAYGVVAGVKPGTALQLFCSRASRPLERSLRSSRTWGVRSDRILAAVDAGEQDCALRGLRCVDGVDLVGRPKTRVFGEHFGAEPDDDSSAPPSPKVMA